MSCFPTTRLVTSLYSPPEGRLPNAVLEAMGDGLPIIMTPCEGSAELVDGNGVITMADEMAKTLIKVGKDEKELNLWGKESRKRIKLLFSWDTAVRRYLELMEHQKGYNVKKFPEVLRQNGDRNFKEM